MADEKIVTSIVANSDFSNLIADVQRVTNSLFRLQQEFAGSNRALAGQINATNAMFKETMLKTGQFSSHFVSLTSDVEKFGRNLDSGRLKLRDYFRVYQENARTSGGLVRDLAKQQVQLQNAILQPLGKNAQGLMQYNVHVPRGLDLTKNKAALLKQELQIMNKVIQDGGVQLINWGKNTQWAGRQLTVGLTLPLVAFGKAAADAFKVADQELTRLTKVYGDIAGTSAQELGKIRQDVSATAKELASAMGVNFTETISLAADIAATGKTGNELLSSVSETTRLAVLGEVDRQEAMKATLAIQTAFKQNTEELSDSINFLNAVENQTSTTLNDLVEAIPKAGPIIKGLGGSIQDLALYLTAMREGGINASEGANALKSALASLINPTDKAVEKFQGFGIDLLGIVQKNAGDVTGTLFALQSALDQLDPLSKQQAIEQLFGKFQFSRLNALFENLGRQGSQTLQVLDLMQASAGELEAVAGRELAQVTESAAGRYRRAIESLKADLAGVGDEFLNIGTKLINVLDSIIKFGQKLPDPLKKLIAFGGAFTAIIGPVIMLTGVLANFFGYIIKGIGHFKALFKGAEGFRLLTPEIIAARAAAGQLTDEFYSDAKATDTLSLAIKKLNEDLLLLQKNATSAKTAVSGLGQTITTAAGTPVGVVGGARVVDPTNPLLGGMSRASAHLNPRNPNDPSTIFGLTMQPIPVNRRIGANPQILMEERLPDVEGLTVVNRASTGVVAGEHARYAALMATLGMQSKREIQELKKTIAMGGQVSADFIATFDDILPITQQLTQNAARQSAAIVAELKAGKLNVQQARDAIIAVNAQLERDMGAQITAYGAATGRTIDLTKAPLIDQPIVDASGKPNTRGMFRKGIFSRVMAAVGRATRTRTVGGPYSIETTRPTGFNMGGQVYSSPNIVPGPNVNADVVPAMLTPGEFVVNREATAANLPLLQAINNGSMGGQVSRGRGNYGPTAPTGYSANEIDMLYGYLDHLTSADYENSTRQNLILNDAISLVDKRGISIPRAIDAAIQIHDRTMKASKTEEEYFAKREAIAKRLGMSTGRIGVPQPAARPELRDAVAAEMRNRGFNRINPNWDRAHLTRRGYSETTRGYFGQTVFDPYNQFSARLTSRLPEIEDRVPLTSAAGHARADYIAKNLGFEDHNDMLLRRADVEQIAKTGRAPRGRTAPIGIFRFLRSALPNAAISVASRGRVRGFNLGGLVPGYQEGGGPIQRPRMGSMLGGMLLSSAGWMGGSALGSRFGTAGSMAGGMLGSMIAPALMGGMGGFGRDQDPTVYTEKLGRSVLAQKQWAQSAKNAAVQGKVWGRVLTGIVGGLTKTNIVIGGAALAIGAATKLWQNYNETQRLSAAAFGLTAQSAEKAGLKFTDYNTKIKDAITAQKLMIDQNTLTYESLQSAGTPFKMTIAEYKKLRKELKDTMAEQIKVINATRQPEVARVAVQLKEQLMAAGLSAEEAAKRIYTLFNLSNKAGQAVSVINTDAFKQIVDAQTAAASALQTFNYAKNFENTRDAAAALNTALTAINTGVEDLIKKSEDAAKKKGKEFDSTAAAYNAEKKQLDIIASKVKSQESIGKDVLNNLKKQNPEIEKFVNSQDTAVSIFQKLRLVARGFTGDLASLNAQQAEAVYQLQIATSKAVTNVNQKGLLSEQYKAYNSLRKEIRELEKAARGQSVKEQIDTKNAIKAIDAKIKKINEEAEARKKALREEAAAQDLNLRIQQQRLEYENRVAAGDFGGAAQAQLELARLVNEQQTVITEQQIEDKRLRDIAPLEKQREALADAQERMADKAALAAESLDSMNKRLATQKERIDSVNDAMTNLKVALELNKDNLEKFKTSEEFKGLAGRLVEAIRGTGQVVANTSLPDVAQGRLQEDIGAMASDVMSKYGAGIDTIIAQQGVRVNATGDIIINGKRTNMAEGTRSIPAPSPEQLMAAPRTSGALVFDTTTGKWTFDTGTLDRGMISYDEYKSGRKKYAGGGLLRGPGTRTSDSILAMYSNGGMVRVSNGEYIVNADTVSRLGVPFFDKINGMKNGGLMLNYDVSRYADGGQLIQTMPYKSEGLYNISNSFTINAADGMNVDELVSKVAAKVENATARAISKIGPERNISKRYNSSRGVR